MNRVPPTKETNRWLVVCRQVRRWFRMFGKPTPTVCPDPVTPEKRRLMLLSVQERIKHRDVTDEPNRSDTGL